MKTYDDYLFELSTEEQARRRLRIASMIVSYTTVAICIISIAWRIHGI